MLKLDRSENLPKIVKIHIVKVKRDLGYFNLNYLKTCSDQIVIVRKCCMFLHTETIVLLGALLPRNLGHPSGFPVSINLTKPLSHFAQCWLIKKFLQRLGVSDLYKTD